MSDMPVRCSLICFVILLLLPQQIFAQNRLTVYTTNYPLTYFTEQIGGDYVKVVFPAPAHVDPAFWTPDAVTVRKFQQADLIILNGAGYEKWLGKISLPLLRIVNTSKPFKENFIHIESTVSHSHGPGGDHSHGGIAFTTWLDFSQAVQQAEAIYKALLRKDPANSTFFTKQFMTLKRNLLSLDEELTALSARKSNSPLIASHPIYHYMARRYNLNLKMVMWEPDTDPDETQWKHLQELTEKHPAEWMIWEDTPLPESEKRLREINITSHVFSPCFNTPQNGDFLTVMQENIKNLEAVFY